MRISLTILMLALGLAGLPAHAADQTSDDRTARLNAAPSPAPQMPLSIAPEKRASERRENYPVQPPPPSTAAKESSAVKPAAGEEEGPPDDYVEIEDKVKMNPVYDKSGKKPATRASDKNNKNILPPDSPFKKSADAGISETISKPDSQPVVSGHPLLDDDISGDIKNLDNLKKPAKATNAEDGVGESGLPIPRFVSLKSGEANARAGAGDTYPIRWVYQRKNLPLEVTAEFRLWRRIKDFDGEQSWVHQALLSSRRYAIISHDANAQSDYADGHNVARFKRGVQVRLVQCRSDACRVEYGDVQGWLKKKDVWGVYGSEIFD